MNGSAALAHSNLHLVSDEELIRALNAELSNALGERCRVTHLDRRFSDYYSSYVMEELDVELEDGRRLELIFKNLSRDGMLEGAVRTKPYFLYNPMREIESYRGILALHRIGTAAFYGAHTDPGAEQYWLFIERVPGTLLWQFGDDEVWQRVAHWLGLVHTQLRFEVEPGPPSRPPHLKVFDEYYYWQWMSRARAFVRRSVPTTPESSVCTIEWLAECFGKVVDRLLSLPVTLVHGEFYPSNVLVHANADEVRVCPVDWETAAIGPGLIDLSALTSGSWTEEQKLAMAMAYFHATQEANGENSDLAEFLVDLDYCNLFMAVQWLGWAPGWEPPPEHTTNWLTEACRVAKKLNL